MYQKLVIIISKYIICIFIIYINILRIYKYIFNVDKLYILLISNTLGVII